VAQGPLLDDLEALREQLQLAVRARQQLLRVQALLVLRVVRESGGSGGKGWSVCVECVWSVEERLLT